MRSWKHGGSIKRDLHLRQKRPTLVSKETYSSVKRDLVIHYARMEAWGLIAITALFSFGYYRGTQGAGKPHKRTKPHKKRPTLVSKETYTSFKRDLVIHYARKPHKRTNPHKRTKLQAAPAKHRAQPKR